jgi:hypothetical protein
MEINGVVEVHHISGSSYQVLLLGIKTQNSVKDSSVHHMEINGVVEVPSNASSKFLLTSIKHLLSDTK